MTRRKDEERHTDEDKHESEADSPSHDVDETSKESFPTSDPPPTWSSAGQRDV